MDLFPVMRLLSRVVRPFAVSVLLVALAYAGGLPMNVKALNLSVDTVADNPALSACTPAPGDCSLRGAINRANADPGADTITFDSALDSLPLILMGASGENSNASGDLDVQDNGNLVIQGNGASKTIIDGDGGDRVFHICPGGSCSSRVIIDSVTIRNGKHTGLFGNGGGIYNRGSDLTLRNSAIGVAGGGNQAPTGGGIYNGGGASTFLDGCSLRSNGATNGGGIYNYGTLRIENSTIGGIGMANTALTGGGIHNASGVATLDGSIVSGNSATYGAGIHNAAILNVENGTLIGGAGAANVATEDGGGIRSTAGTVTVMDSTISANTAGGDGGGVYNEATLAVTNSTIGGSGAANSCNGSGGGICIAGGAVTLGGSAVSANEAMFGGGISNQGNLNVENDSTIGGAGVGNHASSAGGGLYNDFGGTAVVNGSTISANTTDATGGGIYNRAELSIVSGSTIGGPGAGNTATSAGGGIASAAGTVTVEDSTISANWAIWGGGIYDLALLIIADSTIGGMGAGNKAGAEGGGIYNEGGAATLNRTTVSANEAPDGAGIYNEATLQVLGGSIIGGSGAGNSASGGGGGIHNESGTATVDGSIVSANSAGANGGGIQNNASLVVRNGSIIGGAGVGNSAVSAGGGVCNKLGATTTVDSSTVSANEAEYGGGIYNTGSLTVLNGGTIGGLGAGNNASVVGGGIHNWVQGTMVVTGSRIMYNWAASAGGGVYAQNFDADSTTVTGSCIVGNSSTSFFDDLSSGQTATGNWWGASTGPNTPGADTVEGNVDFGGFLTEPILGCYYRVLIPFVSK